MGLTEDMLEPM